MIGFFRKLPVRLASKHVIVDGSLWEVDKEYAELGMRKGWLINHRNRVNPDNTVTKYYIYPNSENTE